MKKVNRLGLLAAAAFSLTLFSYTGLKVADDWNIPAEYKTMKNPTKATADNIEVAKALYRQHCQSCHGRTGLGDGPKAAELEEHAGDFSSKEFQAQSDGVLYYKTTFGKDEMPNYDKKIRSDEDRWLLVHFMRTMGAK
jgi:mono/diheme cytochrome c family protein